VKPRPFVRHVAHRTVQPSPDAVTAAHVVRRIKLGTAACASIVSPPRAADDSLVLRGRVHIGVNPSTTRFGLCHPTRMVLPGKVQV
jgi:hypothetical protein